MQTGHLLAFVGLIGVALTGAVAAPLKQSATMSSNPLFTSEVHELPTLRLDPDVLTIAMRYREAVKRGGMVPAVNTSTTCEIDDDGKIALSTCEPDSWKDPNQMQATMVVRATPSSVLPTFPAIDRKTLGLAPQGRRRLWSKLGNSSAFATNGGPLPFYRLARLTVSIAAMPKPPVNLASGPIVDVSEVELESGRSAGSTDYPAKAIRDKRSGVQTAECQIQEDRSVICENAGFDPADNGPYFENEAERLFARAIVKERLKGGNPAIGVRFRIKLRCVLPERIE